MRTLGSWLQEQRLLYILVLCFSTALALLLCEGVLRVVLRSIHNEGYYLWPPHLKVVFKPSSDVMPGISDDAEFKINSHGIRGDEISPQHTYRVLAIGGSTTMSAYLDQSEMWTYLLQESLNRNGRRHQVWVGNGGLSGATTRHHVIALQYSPLSELRIDAVILLIGINDLSMRLSHDKDYDPDSPETPEAHKELLAQTFRGTYDAYPNDPFYKRTAVWQLLRRAKRLKSYAHFEDERGRVYISWRDHRKRSTEVRDELPDLSSALKGYANNINKLIDIAQEKSVRPIFMTQPTMWKPGLPDNLNALFWLGGIGDFQRESGRPYYSVAALERGIRLYNDTLLQVCKERHVECLDLASVLEKDTTVFYDDVHFNESGSRKVAKLLSLYMLDHTPFRESQVSH